MLLVLLERIQITYGERNEGLILHIIPLVIQKVVGVELERSRPLGFVIQHGGKRRDHHCTLRYKQTYVIREQRSDIRERWKMTQSLENAPFIFQITTRQPAQPPWPENHAD